MPNQALSAADKKSIFVKYGFHIDLIGRAEARRNFLRDSQSRIQEMFEQQNKMSNWKFVGAKIGINVDSGGFLYVDATVAAGMVTVSVYKDTWGGALVAQSVNTAIPVTALALVTQNNSGLSGTVDVAAAMVTDPDVKLLVIQDARHRLSETYSETDEDITGIARGAIEVDLDGHITTADGELAAAITLYEETFLNGWLAQKLDIPDAFIGELHSYSYLKDGGEILRGEEGGILGYLKDVMNDDTTPITVKKPVASIGAATADPDNQGLAVFSATSVLDHSLAGNLYVRCTSASTGSAKFSVELKPTTTLLDGTDSILADNQAQMHEIFQDGPTGIALTIDNGTLTEAGDTGAVVSNFTSVLGENDSNTDLGIFFLRVTRTATLGQEWKIECFSDSGLAAADKNGEVLTALGAGNINLAFSGNELTFNFDFDRTAAAAAMPLVGDIYPIPPAAPVSVDLNVPVVGDSWIFVITNDQAGKFQLFDARHLRFSLNSVGGGAHTVDDDFAKIYPMIEKSE